MLHAAPSIGKAATARLVPFPGAQPGTRLGLPSLAQTSISMMARCRRILARETGGKPCR
jgi:hypothetical protein